MIMSDFENAIPEEEQQLKGRTDEAIKDVGELSEEDLGQMSGGSDGCVEYSKYACYQQLCDTMNLFDCASNYQHECVQQVD
jgi:hypothetical protein